MYEKLKQDMIVAMKEKRKQELDVIKMVKSACDLIRIDQKKEITDDIFLDVLLKQIKMREDSISSFEKANRMDLLEQAKEEINILKKYLPTPLTEEEVKTMIQEAIEDSKAVGMKDMGKVMGLLREKIKGRFDMSKVSEMIKEKLN